MAGSRTMPRIERNTDVYSRSYRASNWVAGSSSGPCLMGSECYRPDVATHSAYETHSRGVGANMPRVPAPAAFSRLESTRAPALAAQRAGGLVGIGDKRRRSGLFSLICA